MSDVTGLIIIAFAIMASAFFSGSETGLVSVNRIRLRGRAKTAHAGVAPLTKILERQERTITAVLIGNNLTIVGGSAVATALVGDRLGSAGPPLAALVMAILLLVFGEMVPKAYFRIKADSVMLYTARPLQIFCAILRPIVELVSVFTNLLFVFFRPKKPKHLVTREDVRLVLKESGQEGVLRARLREMLEGVIELGSTVAREVMIPLPDVVSIPDDATVGDVRGLLRSKGHTRYPVYNKRVDQITGLLNAFDLLFSERRLPSAAPVEPFVRPIPVMPETKRIDRLLFELQKERASMAVIVNEFGACIGIVTVEDIVEEIMGEITDEHEKAELKIRRMSDGSYLLDARMDVDDLNDELDLDLPKERYDTIGGLVLKRLGRIPRVGEKVIVDNVTFEVVGVHKFGIRTIRAILPGEGGPAGARGSGNA